MYTVIIIIIILVKLQLPKSTCTHQPLIISQPIRGQLHLNMVHHSKLMNGHVKAHVHTHTHTHLLSAIVLCWFRLKGPGQLQYWPFQDP